MPVLFNYDDVNAAPMAPGVARRPPITPERVGIEERESFSRKEAPGAP